MTLLLVIAAAIAALALLLWLAGVREPVYSISAGSGPHWFIAVRGDAGALAPGVTATLITDAKFGFIGPDDAYWRRFMIANGGDANALPIDLSKAEDAYVARISLLRPPRLMFGVLKTLIALGVLNKPSGPLVRDAQSLSFRADGMPGANAIARLLVEPPSFAPAMINFLAYKTEAAYANARERVSGRVAYARYGLVAMRTVYRTGGRLLFAGRILAVLREAAAGPGAGRWDDVAAMQYPNPPAILSMEHAPDYHAALHHRDAGLERTVVIATTRRL
ncbi:MAG: DUF1330 domain-containing protein [Hyphomonadaceae bacterium]